MRSTIPERERLLLLYDRYRHEYEAALQYTYRKLRKILIKSNINFTIKYRLKSFDSYFGKILRLRKEQVHPISISDMMGFRVIVPFLEDAEQVQHLLEENVRILEVEHKGEKNSFREFSYDSIHLLIDLPSKYKLDTVPYIRKVAEIQIRTILQEAWAEVEHELIYKANFSPLNGPIKRKLASLNASLTLSDIIFQEIRDYQKGVSQWQEKRQNHFLNKAEQIPQISLIPEILAPVVEETKDEANLNSMKPKNQVDRLIFEALQAHTNNRIDRAIRLYTGILRMRVNPKIRSIIYTHRGMAYFILSEYDKAVKDFSKAIDYDPQNVKAYNNRGISFRMLRQYDRALLDFDTALEMQPYQPETFHLQALTYFDLNDFTRAIENCQKTLNIKPDFEPAKHLKRIILSKLAY